MLGEIIAVGDELTSGRTLNTNSFYAAGHLFAAGHEIIAMATVRDTPAEIGAALKRAIDRADFVIVTGGLGPTSDDLTNEAVSRALGLPTTFYPEVLGRIKSQRAHRPDQKSRDLEKLAWLPEGAEILKPETSIAGYLLVHHEKPVFFLPGIPHQMKELLADKVIPRLALWKGGFVHCVRQKIFKTFGITETEINRKLKHLENRDQNVRIGYYPVFPDVHLSLTVIDADLKKVEQLFQQYVAEIHTLLADSIFGVDEETMADVVGRLLSGQGKTLAVAESCSGGLVAHKITKVAGSSQYFLGGVVAYHNEFKRKFLGVENELLQKHGAVSGPTAQAMAAGIRGLAKADIGIAVTGIAGPTGGSVEKPVGTVFFGLASHGNTRDFRFAFAGDRWQIQELSAQTALELVRRLLLDKLIANNEKEGRH